MATTRWREVSDIMTGHMEELILAAGEMLNRRPDIEDVLLEALELSVNDVLSR